MRKRRFTIDLVPYEYGCLMSDDRGSHSWDWFDSGFHSSVSHLARTLVALDSRGNHIGAFLYFDHPTYARSYGTWVHRDWRKQGVATALWERMLEETRSYNGRRVSVTVVSDSGLTLVDKMRELYPKVWFDVDQNGNRKLRNLKGTAA